MGKRTCHRSHQSTERQDGLSDGKRNVSGNMRSAVGSSTFCSPHWIMNYSSI